MARLTRIDMMASVANFGYDYRKMEEFASPLPPRPTQLPPDSGEAETAIPQPQPQAIAEEPVVPTPTPPSPPPKQKRGVPKVVWLMLGIGIIGLIGFGAIKSIASKFKQNSKGGVTLNYWGLWEDSSVIEGVLAEFESKNPNIKVNYRKNQKDNYRTRLEARLAKDSEEEEVPDIFRIHGSWMPMFKQELAAVPVGVAKNLKLDEDFFEVYKNELKVGANYMAIPLMYDGLAMFYNRDLIESAQVSVPKSWWELQNVVEKLTVRDERGKIKIAGAALGLADNVDHWSDIVGLLIKQNGGEVIKDDGENNQRIRDVLVAGALL